MPKIIFRNMFKFAKNISKIS